MKQIAIYYIGKISPNILKDQFLASEWSPRGQSSNSMRIGWPSLYTDEDVKNQ